LPDSLQSERRLGWPFGMLPRITSKAAALLNIRWCRRTIKVQNTGLLSAQGRRDVEAQLRHTAECPCRRRCIATTTVCRARPPYGWRLTPRTANELTNEVRPTEQQRIAIASILSGSVKPPFPWHRLWGAAVVDELCCFELHSHGIIARSLRCCFVPPDISGVSFPRRRCHSRQASASAASTAPSPGTSTDGDERGDLGECGDRGRTARAGRGRAAGCGGQCVDRRPAHGYSEYYEWLHE
jgi:hypothetical protein